MAEEPVQSFASKKIVAGICGILLGAFGVHKFILGVTTPGVIMLAITLASLVTGFFCFFPFVGAFVMGVIGLIEGIIYLTKSDDEFYRVYGVEKKGWF